MQGFDLFGPLSGGKDSPRACAVGTLYKSAALVTAKWKLEYYFSELDSSPFVADLVASLPGLRIVLPLNAVTALIGAPIVIAVIVRRGGLGGEFS